MLHDEEEKYMLGHTHVRRLNIESTCMLIVGRLLMRPCIFFITYANFEMKMSFGALKSPCQLLATIFSKRRLNDNSINMLNNELLAMNKVKHLSFTPTQQLLSLSR